MFSSKRLISVAVGAMATAVTFGSFAPEAQALSFNFQFDAFQSYDDLPFNVRPSEAPLVTVGDGTFSFDGDPGDGDFALTSLPNYQFALNIGSESFGNDNIVFPDVLVRIANFGGTRRLNFGSSIIFSKDVGTLFIEDEAAFQAFTPSIDASGFYEATVADPTAVPTPALLPSLVGMGVAALRKRKQETVDEA